MTHKNLGDGVEIEVQKRHVLISQDAVNIISLTFEQWEDATSFVAGHRKSDQTP
jgi:hypothetical protein